MSGAARHAKRDIDIRAFIQQDRERIVRAIRKRIDPHLSFAGSYNHTGEPVRMWIDRIDDRGGTSRSIYLDGFVVRTIIGITSDGVVESEDRRSRKTRMFSELPYEDLMKVSSWVARTFPAPEVHVERDSGMAAYIGKERTP